MNKIFKDLQDFAVSPPRTLYARLWKKVKKMQVPSPAQADMVEGKINDPAPVNEEKLLGNLQSYVAEEHTIPAFDFKKIVAAAALTPASKQEELVERKKGRIIFWAFRMAAAAGITGIIFLISVNTGKTDHGLTFTSLAQQIEPVYTANPVHDIPVTAADHPITAANLKLPAKHQRSINTANNHRITGNTFITKSVRANILENDFFYTLTNFTYSQADDFLSDIKENNKISINNYSYVNVSDKMAGFLKQVYAVNRRKKPTWKARKAKQKLDKWKKKDAENFDTKFDKNPLDILDLSEFIFNN